MLKQKKHSVKKLSYFLRHNQFSDLTTEEIVSLFLQEPIYEQNNMYDYYNHTQNISRQMSQHENEFFYVIQLVISEQLEEVACCWIYPKSRTLWRMLGFRFSVLHRSFHSHQL